MVALWSVLAFTLYTSNTNANEQSLNSSTISCLQYADDPSDIDIYLFCQLFEDTDILDLIHEYNFSMSNYCDYSWYLDWNFEINFDCSNNRNSMVKITLTDDYFGGKLITSQQWPPFLQEIDLETPGDKTDTSVERFEGVWNWSTFTQLQYLYEFSIKNNKFSGVITNDDWNNIVSMSQLKVLILAQNYFESNFSDIHMRQTSNIYELQLMDNLLYGSLDTSANGFFSTFPHLSIFVTDNNPHLGGYFQNLNALSSCPISYFEIENNQFSGSIALSNNNLSLSSLSYFNIRNNSFNGDIQWSIFGKASGLTTLMLSHNQFEGIIDWKIIGDLSHNRLRTLELDGNNFDGYANFLYIDVDSEIKIRLDVDIICDPSIYVCGDGAIPINRSSVECKGKKECELSCKCSSTPVEVTTVKDYDTTDEEPDMRVVDVPNKVEFELVVIAVVIAIGAIGIILFFCIYIVVLRLRAPKILKKPIGSDVNSANYQLMKL